MAARRLLIVMLVLLGISSVIAIVVPGPESKDPAPVESTEEGTTGETGETGETGSDNGAKAGAPRMVSGESDVIRRSVDLEARKTERIPAEAGQRVVVTVNADRGSEVEIDGLGLTEFADQYAPAVFDLVVPEGPGRYPIRSGSADPAAVIVVS